MDYNCLQIGKIRYINRDNYYGEIVTSNKKFLFLLGEDEINKYAPGDVVQFRAEQIKGYNRAFFVAKLDNENDFDNKYLKSKTFSFNKGNE